jgi:hypothetical protein
VEELREVEFTGAAEDILLHRGFTWTDFVSAASGKIVWVNAGAFLNLDTITMDTMLYNQRQYKDILAVSNKFGQKLVRVYASLQEHADAACDMLIWR